ncbi:MAG: alpha-D-ribose 1-methylphosphonate 5-triphosphate diphosphatase [Pseudomonadota bacterium]
MTTHFETLGDPSLGVDGVTLSGGTVLHPDGKLIEMDLHLSDGVVQDKAPSVARMFDVSGCLVLPGIVDAHGDGFEHHLMPRVGADFPDWIALRNVDRELVSNGICTAFLAQSYSWEGGIRGVEAARQLIDGVRTLHPAPASDIRVQIRYETFFLDGADQLLAWLEDGTVQYVVFNDHIPQYQELMDKPEHIARWASSVGLSNDEFKALLEKTVEDGVGVLDGIARLSEAMTRLGLPFGSHDDPDPETRQSYNNVGARIAEFPLTVAAAETARSLGNSIMMGAPNALRGKSATANVSARELIGQGLCDALVSDYYYPALLHAPFALVRDDVTELQTAWGLVSSGPAAALGLHDRGLLWPGLRGDVVVVQQDQYGRPFVVATFVEGRPVFLGPSFAASGMSSAFERGAARSISF